MSEAVRAADVLPMSISSGLRQRLDLAHHLIGFGRQLIIVSGASGGGRTRVLDTIAAEANPEWVVVRVDGRAISHPAQLVETLFSELDPATDLSAQTPSEREALLHGRLNLLHAERRLALLVVDNADEWDTPLKALLFRLAHRDSEVGELRVVISCRNDTDAVATWQACAPAAAMPHVIVLPLLEQPEIGELLDAATDNYGLAPEMLDAATRARLIDTAQGNPGRLLQALTDLLDSGVSEGHAAVWFSPAVRRAGGIAVVGFAALGLIALTFFNRAREHGEREPPPAEVEIPLPSDAPPPASSPTVVAIELPRDVPTAAVDAVAPSTLAREPDTTRSASPSAPSPVVAPAAVPAAPLLAGGKQPRALEPPPPASPQAASPVRADAGRGVAVEAAAPPTPPDSAGAKALPAAPKTASPAKPRPAPPPTPTPAKREAIEQPTAPATSAYTSKWVLTQPDDHYVIQLFGSRERGAAERFISRYKLAPRATVFALTHQGQPWYTVTYGLYPGRAQANAAIADLPAPLRAAGAWARAVGTLRK